MPRKPAKPATRGRRRRPASPRHELHGRATLVTGAGVRIGAAIARALAAAGCDVVLHHHRSARQAKALADELAATGVHAAVVSADLSKPTGVDGLVAAAAKAIGRPIDLLVNNAASFPERRLADLSWNDLSSTLALDAWAPFALTRALSRQLARGVSGSVVNLLDARIADDDRAHAGYFLAKRLLTDLTRLSALEFGPRVAVNAVAPGPTLAPQGWGDGQAEAWTHRLSARLPLRRTPTPQDVARAVVYLAGSTAHTGQVLYVDGGRHLGRPEA